MNKSAVFAAAMTVVIVVLIGVYIGGWWAVCAGMSAGFMFFMAGACRQSGEYDEISEEELEAFIRQEQAK